MIEVLFGESEAGAMKAAKNTVIYGKTDGPTSVWIAGKKKPPKRQPAGWVPGNAQEVVCLGFLLDIGDIREPADSEYRRNLLHSLYAQDQWEYSGGEDAELREMAGVYVKEMERLERFLKEGEEIRIWYSDAPYSRCGFYHLCTLLEKYENDISVVKLPEYGVRTDSITIYSNWGEVAAEEFAAFLPQEKKLSKQELHMNVIRWKNLVEDNSPLRAVVNGKVVGVPENFYDFLIWSAFPKEPIKEARLIGNILGHYQMGIGDWWYAGRIEHFIRIGRIKVVENSKSKYARIICRC